MKAIWTDLDSKYPALPKADIDKLKARMRDLLIYSLVAQIQPLSGAQRRDIPLI